MHGTKIINPGQNILSMLIKNITFRRPLLMTLKRQARRLQAVIELRKGLCYDVVALKTGAENQPIAGG